MNVFITGATGSVGRSLTRLLLEKGYQVSCLVRNIGKAREFFDAQIKLIQGDLSDLSKGREEVDSYLANAETICHLAACVSSSKTKDFFLTNAQGTNRLCDILAQSKKLKKIIYLSSLSVVGRNHKELITENATCAPFSPYGKSKLLAERIMKAFHEKHSSVSVYILRVPVIYGEGQSDMVSHFFRNIERGRMVIPGNGKNTRSMCYIRNLTSAIAYLVNRTEIIKKLEIINIADKEQLNFNNLILLIARKMNKNIKIQHTPSIFSFVGLVLYKFLNFLGFNSLRLFTIATATANVHCVVDKALSMGIPLNYSLARGLEKTVYWFQKNEIQRT